MFYKAVPSAFCKKRDMLVESQNHRCQYGTGEKGALLQVHCDPDDCSRVDETSNFAVDCAAFSIDDK